MEHQKTETHERTMKDRLREPSAPRVDVKKTDRKFADQHQFSERGKSQKSFDRQNPPLTIEQVRELLNKNK